MAGSRDVSTRRVLVVDDDKNDFFLLRIAFEKAGLRHLLIHLHNGQEAVNYLSTHFSLDEIDPRLSLILLDLKMPIMDGFDVLLWLQRNPKRGSVPVVVLSSSSLIADKEKAMHLGAMDYLTKPSGLEELFAMVKDLHDRWLKD